MKNEPINFADDVVIGLSTKADGDIRLRDKTDGEAVQIRVNCHNFLKRLGVDEGSAVLVKVDYDTTNFCRYKTIQNASAGRGMRNVADIEPADALFTRERNLALFLPLADCLGAVLYDTKNKVLAVAHLGRHSTEQHGAKRVIEYMIKEFNSSPQDIKIWLSPSAGKGNYPVYTFNNRSLQEINVEHFTGAGIPLENITQNPTDTTTDENYFSHSQGDTDKRFAIVAYIRNE